MKEFFMEWGGAVIVGTFIGIALVGGSVVSVHYIDANKANCQALIAKDASAPVSCFK